MGSSESKWTCRFEYYFFFENFQLIGKLQGSSGIKTGKQYSYETHIQFLQSIYPVRSFLIHRRQEVSANDDVFF